MLTGVDYDHFNFLQRLNLHLPADKRFMMLACRANMNVCVYDHDQYDPESFIAEWFDQHGKLKIKNKSAIELKSFSGNFYDLSTDDFGEASRVRKFDLNRKKDWGKYVVLEEGFLGNEVTTWTNRYHKYMLLVLPDSLDTQLQLDFAKVMRSIFRSALLDHGLSTDDGGAQLRGEIASAIEYALRNEASKVVRSFFNNGFNFDRMCQVLRALDDLECLKRFVTNMNLVPTPKELSRCIAHFGHQNLCAFLVEFFEPRSDMTSYVCEFIVVSLFS